MRADAEEKGGSHARPRRTMCVRIGFRKAGQDHAEEGAGKDRVQGVHARSSLCGSFSGRLAVICLITPPSTLGVLRKMVMSHGVSDRAGALGNILYALFP